MKKKRRAKVMVRNKEKDFGKTAQIRGAKAQSEAVRPNGSINSEPQERLKENR
jgi:small acid-soluble spore protein K (minor)